MKHKPGGPRHYARRKPKPPGCIDDIEFIEFDWDCGQPNDKEASAKCR